MYWACVEKFVTADDIRIADSKTDQSETLFLPLIKLD